MDDLKCLRCGASMEYSGRKQFQLGEEIAHNSFLAEMYAESVRMDIFKCPDCGKIEFFEPRARKSASLPKSNWTCSQCGTYNLGRVQNCQGCGVTRAWSEKQQKEK